jgi:hypothetical protein
MPSSACHHPHAIISMPSSACHHPHACMHLLQGGWLGGPLAIKRSSEVIRRSCMHAPPPGRSARWAACNQKVIRGHQKVMHACTCSREVGSVGRLQSKGHQRSSEGHACMHLLQGGWLGGPLAIKRSSEVIRRSCMHAPAPGRLARWAACNQRSSEVIRRSCMYAPPPGRLARWAACNQRSSEVIRRSCMHAPAPRRLARWAACNQRSSEVIRRSCMHAPAPGRLARWAACSLPPPRRTTRAKGRSCPY